MAQDTNGVEVSKGDTVILTVRQRRGGVYFGTVSRVDGDTITVRPPSLPLARSIIGGLPVTERWVGLSRDTIKFVE